MEEMEPQEITTEESWDKSKTEDELAFEATQISNRDAARSSLGLSHKQKIILKTFVAFLLLSVGVVLVGLCIYLNEDDVPASVPQICLQ